MEDLPAYHRSRTGRISEHIFAVSSPVVSFYVYVDGKTAVCFDTGSRARAAEAALGRIGIDPASVSHVFLTHSDGDHVGGVAAFPKAKFLFPRAEEPIVAGLSLRRILFLRHRNHLKVAWVPVDDGEIVEAGGIAVRAIATPGHTMGSTSYLVNDEALFTGDLIMLRDGKAGTSPAFITEDAGEVARSVARLAEVVPSVAILCTAHSGYTTDYESAMAGWRGSVAGSRSR